MHIKQTIQISRRHPYVESSEATGGNQAGAVRAVHLTGSGTIIEELTAHSMEKRSLSYEMKNPGPLPVSDYSSSITVNAKGNGSVVEWRGQFYCGDPNNDPAPECNDDVAIEVVSDIYQEGLSELKKQIEK